MDFFERQDQARQGTRKLVVLFVLAVLATVIALNAIAAGVLYLQSQQQDRQRGEGQQAARFEPADLWQPAIYGIVTVATLAVIGGASAYKTAQISGDGGKVATLMGGRKLDPQSTDDDERKLLNVVEEMSIASGVPVPDVYLLDQEDGINAFAAGSSVGEAALGVTRGTVTKLDRDELQGVIAHEFSHILNGDMKLNLRLVGIIFGILVIGLVGYGIFRVAPYLSSGRSNNRRDDKGAGAGIAIALFVVGAAVWLVGSIGVFFGRWIQASVSRQREYLADASAVQFTRNPLGIRDALRKIGGTSAKATVANRHAGEISHMWFGEAFDGLFATHPPLDKRIQAVDPNWDGTMLKAEHVQPADAARRSAERRAARQQQSGGRQDDFLDIFGTGAAAGLAGGSRPAPPPVRLKANNVTDRVGKLDQAHLDFATMLVKAIPPELREAARDAAGARGVIAAMLLSDDRSVRTLQDEALAQKDPLAGDAAEQFVEPLRRLGPPARLPLVDLCLPALRRLDGPTRTKFLQVLDLLIGADDRVEPFEYALYKLVEQHLGPDGNRNKSIRYQTIGDVAEAAGTLLSALAAAGSNDAAGAAAAYKAGIGRLRQGQIAYSRNFSPPALNAALNRLSQSSPAVKRDLIDAAAATVAADGVVEVEEAELLRAFGAVLECPLPPFIERAGGRPAAKV